jgi:hypothetical protein
MTVLRCTIESTEFCRFFGFINEPESAILTWPFWQRIALSSTKSSKGPKDDESEFEEDSPLLQGIWTLVMLLKFAQCKER